MNNEQTDKEFNSGYYTKMYEQIQGIVLECYADYSLLDFYNHQSLETRQEYSRHPTLYHIFNLVKQDLCLNLWKICYDTSSKACTIQKLFSYLRSHKKTVEYKKTTYLKKLQKPITEARHKYLAHSDIEKVENSILIDSMKYLLEETRNALNSLCFKEYGTKTISDKQLSAYVFRTKIDAFSLLHLGEKDN